MFVEVYRVTGEPVRIEVKQAGTVKDVFQHPKSGQVLGHEGSLLEAVEELYDGIEGLGTLRVNGASATLDTPVKDGDTILIIPKVEGALAC